MYGLVLYEISTTNLFYPSYSLEFYIIYENLHPIYFFPALNNQGLKDNGHVTCLLEVENIFRKCAKLDLGLSKLTKLCTGFLAWVLN